MAPSISAYTTLPRWCIGHSCAWVILVVALIAYQCRYKRVPPPRNPTRVLQSAPTLDRLMTRHPNVTSRPPRACGAPCQSAALLVHEAERVLQEATDADGRLDVRTAQREYAHRRQLYKGNTTVRHFYMIERVRVDSQDQFVWRATPEADSVNFTSKEVNATLVSAECPSGICDDHAINVVMFKDTNPTTKRYSYVEYPWFNRKTNAVGYGVDIVCRYNQDVYICAGYNYPDALPTPPDCGVALTVMGIYSLFFVGMFLLPGVYHQLAPDRKPRRASSVVGSSGGVLHHVACLLLYALVAYHVVHISAVLPMNRTDATVTLQHQSITIVAVVTLFLVMAINMENRTLPIVTVIAFGVLGMVELQDVFGSTPPSQEDDDATSSTPSSTEATGTLQRYSYHVKRSVLQCLVWFLVVYVLRLIV